MFYFHSALRSLLVLAVLLSTITVTGYEDFSESEITRLLAKFEKDLYGEHHAHWYRPNELYPQEAKPYYEQASEGWHIAVGSERGFIGFAANPRATGLVLTDIDAGVLLFNRINLALLRLAKDRAHFIDLRESVRLWKPALKSANFITHSDRELLSREDVKQFWDQNVARWHEFALVDGRKKPTGRDDDEYFGSLRYPLSEVLFNRLQSAAHKNRILIKRLNWNDLKNVEELLKELTHTNKIGLFDISNAWQSSFIHQDSKKFIFSLLKQLGSEQTLFVGTTMAPDVRLISVSGLRSLWTYFAIPLKKVDEQAWFVEGDSLRSGLQGEYIRLLERNQKSLCTIFLTGQ